MEIRRGDLPKSVERELHVDVTAEEVLTILTSYIKRKLNTDRVRVDSVEAALSKDTGKLLTMTLLGAEVIPLSWKDQTPSETPQTSGENTLVGSNGNGAAASTPFHK